MSTPPCPGHRPRRPPRRPEAVDEAAPAPVSGPAAPPLPVAADPGALEARSGSGFHFQPIAVVRSPYARRIDAPHQATVVAGTATGDAAEARIEFVDTVPAGAFRDLAGFDRVWLLFVFDRSQGWTAEVRPPRGGGRRSVLATRAPHRPNPIGLSAVELLAVEPRALRVRALDLLDGTPILDIKPYVPYADAFPDAAAGWIDALDARTGRQSAPGPRRPRRT